MGCSSTNEIEGWESIWMKRRMGELYITVSSNDVKTLLRPKTTIAVATLARSEGYGRLWRMDWPSKERGKFERKYCFRKTRRGHECDE